MIFIKEQILHAWQSKNGLFYLVLTPLSWVFRGIVWLRRLCYRVGLLKSYALPMPVIVVGNITTGGSGKTPVVMWLVEALKANGYHPGVISRGYGVKVKAPTQVLPSSEADEVGDEPLLIAKRGNCPVWIGANRVKVGEALLAAHPECNVIISDDGLQHYRLKRTVEIAVLDTQVKLSRLRLLPAGNLREPISRLKRVDAIICHGQKIVDADVIQKAFQMQLVGAQFVNLADGSITATAADFKRKAVKAMAGIGNPARFYTALRNLGLTFAAVSFEDHHAFTALDLIKLDCDVLIMTEKDAVKCQSFAKPHHWVLPVEAEIEAGLLPLILQKIAKK